MKTIVATLRISFDQVINIENAILQLEDAIQIRIFGEGIFDTDTLINSSGLSIESLSLDTTRKNKTNIRKHMEKF